MIRHLQGVAKVTYYLALLIFLGFTHLGERVDLQPSAL